MTPAPQGPRATTLASAVLLCAAGSAVLSGCGGQRAGTLPEVALDDPIEYVRHEFRQPPDTVTGTLLTLVYDTPYLGACGVFPPRYVIDQVFADGGGDAGMGPGTSWRPFRISEATYLGLLEQVRTTDPLTLQGQSRYAQVKFREDTSFDGITDRFAWMAAVCAKHRERYEAEQRALR